MTVGQDVESVREAPGAEPSKPLSSFDAEMEARMAAEYAAIAASLIKPTRKTVEPKRWSATEWATRRRRRKMARASRRVNR